MFILVFYIDTALAFLSFLLVYPKSKKTLINRVLHITTVSLFIHDTSCVVTFGRYLDIDMGMFLGMLIRCFGPD